MNEMFPDGLVGIIYDCDGVMIDSAAANRRLYNMILKELGLPPITREQELSAFQATYAQAIRAMVPGELHGRIAAAEKTVDYGRDILPKIGLMPGYREFVDKAAERGLRQAIDTNRTRPGINRIIEKFGLAGIFDPIVNCDNTVPKPSPEGVKKICGAWACAPDRVLYVGDSPDDRSAARGGGAVFAAFGERPLAGDINVKSWAELAQALWPAE